MPSGILPVVWLSLDSLIDWQRDWRQNSGSTNWEGSGRIRSTIDRFLLLRKAVVLESRFAYQEPAKNQLLRVYSQYRNGL